MPGVYIPGHGNAGTIEMLGRGRSEVNLLLPLPLAALVGAIGIHVAAGRSIDLAMVAAFWFIGLLIGFLPYMALAVPACLYLEREECSAFSKTLILTACGIAVGHVLGGYFAKLMPFLWIWALAIGGCSGFLLGYLRD